MATDGDGRRSTASGRDGQLQERGNRLREAVEGIGIAQAARRAGVPYTTLRDYMNGGEMKFSAVASLAAECGVSLDWLAFGDAPGSARPAPGFAEAVPAMRGATVPSGGSRRPDLQDVLADNGQIVDYLLFDPAWVSKNFQKPPDQILLIQARGDGMEPTIRNGDLLVIDVSTQEISTSSIHAIESEGELLLKRLERRLDGSIYVYNDNERYAPQTVAPADRHRLHIVGHVIWQGGPPRS